MTTPFSGGCACGATRYSCSAEPIVSYVCHCADCQKRTGSAFGVSVQVPADAVIVEQGEPGERQRTAASGNAVSSLFCPQCGTTVMSFSHARSNIRVIAAGTLDHPSWVPIMAHIWTGSAVPWFPFPPEIENSPAAPDFSRYYE
jgi:hypothetical protein